MSTSRKTQAPRPALSTGAFESHEHRILLLQGGGALGAYHGGVYDGIAGVGFAPDWVVGISIGAINAALIVGNPPEGRIARLREFWSLVSSQAPVRPAVRDGLCAPCDEQDGGRIGDVVRHPGVLLAPHAATAVRRRG